VVEEMKRKRAVVDRRRIIFMVPQEKFSAPLPAIIFGQNLIAQ
jgi:hypothetical protein